jgi:cyclase
MKFRIIPTILTNGLNVVKGEKFNNWRTVGSAEAVARVFARRDVDELLLLDVFARSNKTTISSEVMNHFTTHLNVPFSVGGGINTVEDAKICFRNGAEKIVLSTSAFLNPNLVYDIAEIFGSQAVIVAVDFKDVSSEKIMINSGKDEITTSVEEVITNLEENGVGELLVQSCFLDGTMLGMDNHKIKRVSKLANVPIIASSGAASLEDFLYAIQSGASAVAAGAVFQYTQITPNIVSKFLSDNNVNVRIK